MQMQRGRPRKPSNLTTAIGVSVVLHLLLFVLISFNGTSSGSRADSGQHMVLTALEFGWAEDPTTAAGKDSASDPAPDVRQEPAVAETPDETKSEQTEYQTKDQTADAVQQTERGEYFAISEQGAGSQDAPPDTEPGALPGAADGTPRLTGTTEARPPRVELPQPLVEISPDYPLQARRRGLEGVVVIRVTISPSGEPLETTIVSPSAHAQLNEAAVSAVRAARFQPGTIDMHPSEMSLSIRIVFEVS